MIPVILTDGFEEIEAITITDVLRRADLNAQLIGLDKISVTGSHGIQIRCDSLLDDLDLDEVEMLVLPGGEPGTTHLQNSSALCEIILELHRKQIWLAAICAAPRIFDGLGILQGKRATNHPSQAQRMVQCQYEQSPVVVSQNLITSRGPGTALPFALTLVEKLRGPELSNTLADNMLVSYQEISI